MRILIIGLGVQGRKRLAVAGADVVATVDPIAADASYRSLEDVPFTSFDAALVCTPDVVKLPLLLRLLAHNKHVLVEKPLLGDSAQLQELMELARVNRVACYTGYNHRFEPHICQLHEWLVSGALGRIHLARFFYGNGTARDVQGSPWRDQGLGVLSDLGSHVLDLVLHLFGPTPGPFRAWAGHRFENRAFDHCAFGTSGPPAIQGEVSLVSWRNSFTVDVIGELGSAHIHGLCKWGPSILTRRQRVFPSGRPREEAQVLEQADPTWELEHAYFKELCRSGGTNLPNDVWINRTLQTIAGPLAERRVA
jgi:predicted dehydrogenase